MSRLLRHPAYLAIEDELDVIGQKYRVLRIVRGMMLWLGCALVATFAALLGAHCLGAATEGHSRWIVVLLALWAGWLAVSGVAWFVRPMILRPRALEVARLVESRVDGLHNGLTNTLLLAERDDLETSPWVPPILDEIVATVRGTPVGQAVRFADLLPLTTRLAVVLLPLLMVCAFPGPRRALMHGWQQIFNPTRFVPKIGSVEAVDVQPGNITLIAGQPLEVTVVARGFDLAAPPNGKLIFDAGGPKSAELTGALTTDASRSDAAGRPSQVMRYSYRVDHVDRETRYRVDVGGTQSDWYGVSLVKQVKLVGVTIDVAPPAYTNLPVQHLTLKPEELGKTALTVPQGSKVELAATIDVPVKAAMLQLGDAAAPTPMQASQGGQRFVGSLVVLDETPVSLLLSEGIGQVIARLPEQGLVIHCLKDGPPQIEMKWPTQDTAVTPDAKLTVQALLKDDYGVTQAEVLMGAGNEQGMQVIDTQHFAGKTAVDFAAVLDVRPELRKDGKAIKVQLVVTDNRGLQQSLVAAGRSQAQADAEGGPQTASSSIYEIKFHAAEQIAKADREKTDRLREALLVMLKQQTALHERASAFKPGNKDLMSHVASGQGELRLMMQQTASFEFDADTKIIQKTLLVLCAGHAKDAVEVASAIQNEPIEKQQAAQNLELLKHQRRIVATLEGLLSLLSASPEPVARPTTRQSDPLALKKEKLEKLREALKEFQKEEQRILDQTASLAKKPVDNFTDADKKLLEELKMAQEKMDAFMEQALSDFSKNPEQDMSNGALLKDLMSVYSEVTMAKDALKEQAKEIAVAAEEMGLAMENAKELESNIEKWLPDKPDRAQWTQEDPLSKQDLNMPELPKELEDMVGELMEQQEDLFEQMEDANANYASSMDKGVGWDAMDGPIADMSAKGVTGNTLPNDNEMAGRSGEGRQGKSQGEFVGDTAVGKGGRNTATRLDPTPFSKGQIKDESKDPTGGATGGGKLSGQGGQGLEGPVPPKMKQEMQRLAEKQAQLRNNAERLNLQYQLGRYDNFKLLEAIGMMRRVESDLGANRYAQAMRRKDVLLDELDTSHNLLSGQLHVKRDTTPEASTKLKQEIDDAMKGELPPAWADALKEYYKKLGRE